MLYFITVYCIYTDYTLIYSAGSTITGQGHSQQGYFLDRKTLTEFRSFVWSHTIDDVDYGVCDDSGVGDFPPSQTPSQTQTLYSTPNKTRLLTVTILIRTFNRYITNYDEIYTLLQSYNNILDMEWLEEHRAVVMDSLSFAQQVKLMRDTDIVISVHGTALVNSVFMQPYSVAIALMQSRHVEYVLPQVSLFVYIGYI